MDNSKPRRYVPVGDVGPQFKKTELHTITRQQVYNIWLSLTRKQWERDATDDFRSAQLLVEGQEGYRLIEGLQEPGVLLAFITPCFSDSVKYIRAKMTEIFIRRGVQEEDKRGTRLTAWFTALRAAGLNPNVVHTDKDFAEVTAASIAFKRNNDGYNHHLCIWHSLRAIDQYITGKLKARLCLSICIFCRTSLTGSYQMPKSKQCTQDLCAP
ncbi:hypothetical protein V1519DRAFT_469889 [Lipomyces tetrasporus]